MPLVTANLKFEISNLKSTAEADLLFLERGYPRNEFVQPFDCAQGRPLRTHSVLVERMLLPSRPAKTGGSVLLPSFERRKMQGSNFLLADVPA